MQAEDAERERQAQELEKQREREVGMRIHCQGQKFELFQALALAILNGTADKMELEKREKEENEWVSITLCSHYSLTFQWKQYQLTESFLLRAWVRKTDADLEAAAKAAQLEEDREIPILPYSSLFILSSNNK